MGEKVGRETLDARPDVGRILGIGRNTVYREIRSGKIPALRFGKRVVVSRAELDKLLKGKT